jgi:hypothetical protein
MRTSCRATHSSARCSVISSADSGATHSAAHAKERTASDDDEAAAADDEVDKEEEEDEV